jgi:hypothetical protein
VECAVEELSVNAPPVGLEDGANVAIENEIPESVAYDAVAYTEGAGALNKSSVTLQHAVFVRLTRSACRGTSPLLQHHVLLSGHWNES